MTFARRGAYAMSLSWSSGLASFPQLKRFRL